MKLRGVAYDTNFTLVINGTITFSEPNSLTQPVSAQTDDSGNFEIALPAGKWITDKIIAVTEIEID